jgi:hypothetical protein
MRLVQESWVCWGRRRCLAAARAWLHRQGPLLPGGVCRAGLHARACLVWCGGCHMAPTRPLPSGLQVLGRDAQSGAVQVCLLTATGRGQEAQQQERCIV